MKILQVTRQYYPTVGGIQTAIAHLSYKLQSFGYDVGVLALNRSFTKDKSSFSPNEIIHGIPVERISYWGPRQYAIAPGALSSVKKWDLIHLHSSDFFLDYFAFTRLLHNKPIVFTTHGMYFHTKVARVIKEIYFYTITRHNLKSVYAVICVSQQDYKLLNKITPSSKLYLIPNGINYDKLTSEGKSSRDPNLILSVGRLAENKGHNRMLNVFARVVEKCQEARLIVIGPDLGTHTSLEKLCKELTIENKVKFLGKISEMELIDYLHRANIWLSAAYYESFGIALLEAMAAGCLPVVQCLPAFERLIYDQVNGYVTNFDEYHSAANVIIQALNLSEQVRSKMISSGREQASNYSWNTIARKIETIYLRALI